MRKLAIRGLLLVATILVLLAGVFASSAFAAPTTPQDFARPIVNSHVGDVPAPFEGGIFNNIDKLPDAAFNSVTRNPVCGAYTGTSP